MFIALKSLINFSLHKTQFFSILVSKTKLLSSIVIEELEFLHFNLDL